MMTEKRSTLRAPMFQRGFEGPGRGDGFTVRRESRGENMAKMCGVGLNQTLPPSFSLRKCLIGEPRCGNMQTVVVGVAVLISGHAVFQAAALATHLRARRPQPRPVDEGPSFRRQAIYLSSLAAAVAWSSVILLSEADQIMPILVVR